MRSWLTTWIRHTLWAEYPTDLDATAPADERPYPLDWRTLAPRHPNPQYVPSAGKAGRSYFNPVSVALYALARHSEFVHVGDASARDAFALQAEALRQSQDPNGGWTYPVRIRRYGVSPGWYSGMGQGLAVSVFVRAWALSQDDGYLDAATQAVELMTRSTANGGCALIDAAGRPFIEECPSEPPSYILNGAIFAIIGWLEIDPVAARSAVERLSALLPRYDNGHWSRYDLRYGASASYAYHMLHVSQLRVLSHLTGDPTFRGIARRWRRQARNPRCRSQAALEKAAFAIRHAGS